MAIPAAERAKTYRLTEQQASEDMQVAQQIDELASKFISRAGLTPPAEGEMVELSFTLLDNTTERQRALEELRIVQRGTLAADGLRPTEIFMRSPEVGMLSGDSHDIQAENLNRKEGPIVRASLTLIEPSSGAYSPAKVSEGIKAVKKVKEFIAHFKSFHPEQKPG